MIRRVLFFALNAACSVCVLWIMFYPSQVPPVQIAQMQVSLERTGCCELYPGYGFDYSKNAPDEKTICEYKRRWDSEGFNPTDHPLRHCLTEETCRNVGGMYYGDNAKCESDVFLSDENEATVTAAFECD